MCAEPHMHVRSSLVKLGTSVYTCATCSVWPYAAPQPPLQARWLGPVLVSRARLPCRQRAGWCGAPPLNCCARAPTSERAAQAVCLVVRNQHADIREWLEHHLALGAGRFYVFDNNSTAPMLDAVLDLVQAGVVEYHYLTAFRHHSNKRAPGPPAAHGGSGNAHALLPRRPFAVPRPSPPSRGCSVYVNMSKAKGAQGLRRRRPQLYVYDTCIEQYRARHRWMAFIDADEFFVLRDARAPDLPALLAEYEQFGALAVNWQARRARCPRTRACSAPAPPWCRSAQWSAGGSPRSRRAANAHRGTGTAQCARWPGHECGADGRRASGGGAVGPRHAAGRQHAGGVSPLPACTQPGQPARQGHREPGVRAARGRRPAHLHVHGTPSARGVLCGGARMLSCTQGWGVLLVVCSSHSSPRHS